MTLLGLLRALTHLKEVTENQSIVSKTPIPLTPAFTLFPEPS